MIGRQLAIMYSIFALPVHMLNVLNKGVTKIFLCPKNAVHLEAKFPLFLLASNSRGV
jgi:hypothetical protein